MQVHNNKFQRVSQSSKRHHGHTNKNRVIKPRNQVSNRKGMEILKISDIIKGIADQTNILAFAAIELAEQNPEEGSML